MHRSTLLGLASVVAGLVLLVPSCATKNQNLPDDDASMPPDATMAGCPSGYSSCGNDCFALKRDPTNCGTCGKQCAGGEVCVQGGCALQCGGSTTKCGALCIDTKSNPDNCGMCGGKCPQGQVCSLGKCAISCEQGFTDCSGACLDLQTDDDNCGACNTSCGIGQHCAMGKCVANCQKGWNSCPSDGGTTCVDLGTDNSNCGACGVQCPMGQFCSPGADGGMATCGLQCFGGTVKCGNKCADLQVDPQNCGACNTPCNGTCFNGKCCSGNQLWCGACTDIKTDANNCGGCGIKCAGPCNNGVCCGAGETICNGKCVNLQSDPQNCNQCGKKCDPDAGTPSCSMGTCVASYLSCLQIKQGNPNSASGTYPLNPSGGSTFTAYCDMTTDGGGWTLLTWAADASVTPYGPAYPGYAQCPALNCKRGSGVPINQLTALFNISKSFGKGQSVSQNIKPTYDLLGTYQYAGKYVYPTLSGLQVQYAANVPCNGFQTGTYTNIVNTVASATVYLSQYFAYTNHNDFSSDTAGLSIWEIGVPNGYCDGSGSMPGSWMGNWLSSGQYGPGQAAVVGSYAIYIR